MSLGQLTHQIESRALLTCLTRSATRTMYTVRAALRTEEISIANKILQRAHILPLKVTAFLFARCHASWVPSAQPSVHA